MNRKLILFLAVGVVTVLCSCKKDKNDPPSPVDPSEVNYTFITSVESLLTPAIKTFDDVLSIQSNKKLEDVTLTPPEEIDPIKKDNLKRIKTIDKFADGQVISDIWVWEKYAFVSYYNPNSAVYQGTIDVFSIEKLPGIVRMARFSFPKSDIHAVSYVLGRLVLVGSQEDKSAFVETIVYNPSLSEKMAVLEHMIDLSATNARGVVATSNNVYALADDNTQGAGVYVFSDLTTMEQKPFVAIDQPLSMVPVRGSNNVYILQKNSIVQVTSSGTKGTEPLTINAPSNNMGIAAKDRVYVHVDNSVQVFGPKNQSFDWNESSSGNQSLHPNHKNVAIMKDWLMVLGNGGADIKLCGLRNNQDFVTEVSDLGGLNSQLSFLAANDNVAFVVDQNSAIQILWRASKGFPEVPIYELDMKETSTVVSGAMKEGRNNFNTYQNLHNCPSSIKIKTPTKVYVSVALQDAQYYSSLGYYLLRNSSLPEKSDDLNKIIVFPNTRTANSIGNTVALCDADGKEVLFESGQEIGFYLVSNGWNSSLNDGYGGVDTSKPTMYTHMKYNKGNYQQHLLYRLENRYPVFIGFEDQLRSNTTPAPDSDMNDIVIAISDNITGAAITNFDMTNVLIPGQ